MRLSLGAGLFVASASSAFAHEGYHHHDHQAGNHHHGHGDGQHQHDDHSQLRPHTHIAYHHVEQACSDEVEKLCAPKQQVPETFGDPLLDWVFLPQAPQPRGVEDPSVMFDRMFNSFFGEPITLVTVYFQEEMPPQEQAPLMADSMAAKLAADKQPEEIPDLVHQLRLHGKELMAIHEEDSMHHRMARRLTEVDANTIQHHARLPFGCPKNRCLKEAMAAGKVSKECSISIQQYESTYILEEELEHRQEIFVGMMWIYIAVLSILLILLAKNYRNHRGQQRLRTKILRAIYSNPGLKRKVELELGESVGSAPPLPAHVLRLMSTGGKDLRRQLKCLKRVHTIFFAVLLTLVFVAPFWVLPICILISVVRVGLLCLMNNEPVDGDCECCCCGASSTDAAQGLLTESQQCCGCCKGTGVCAVGCDSCRGPDGCCCCGCCDGACTCCDGKMRNNDEACCSCCGCCDGSCTCAVYKMTDDCTCCCCGVTAAQVKAGNVSDAQACCNCCKGLGVCDPSCASCCGGGACCCCGATAEAAKNGTLTDAQACCCCCGGSGCCTSCSCCCGAKVKNTVSSCCSCCGCCDGSCNCASPKKMTDDCTCCCCGVTAAQIKAGTVTDAQACCTCCKGLGVCDPSCASCCGGGGCCCCCGATAEAAKNGTLTDAQACCCCCGGSGCCTSCSCCGSGAKGRGKKHVVAARTCVYEGIPLQIV